MIEKEYRSWIMSQTDPSYELHETDHRITLTAANAEAAVVFYEQSIVELVITDTKTGSIRFYLHFQLKDLEHGKQLFNEMAGSLIKLKDSHKVRVLLSCSSALTTSYFAEELNRTAEALNLDYEFTAVSFNLIYQRGFEFDVILIAQQIGYEYEKVRNIFRKQLVLKIPTAVFAGYNAGGIFELLMESKHMNEDVRNRPHEDPVLPDPNDYRILTMGLISHRNIYRFAYRIYDHGMRTLNKEVIKETFGMSDLEDLMDYIVTRHKRIDLIGLAMPGITNQGHLTLPKLGFFNAEVGQILSAKYGIPVILLNDVNATAMGYHVMNPQCRNLVFYCQPTGSSRAGAGIIIDGKLHSGRMHTAGEVAPVIDAFVQDPEKKIMDPEGAMEIVCAGLLPCISFLAPERIVLYSVLTPDPEEIRRYLSRYVDPAYIPEIEHVDHLKTYMLPGIMKRCLEVLNERSEWIRSVYQNASKESE